MSRVSTLARLTAIAFFALATGACGVSVREIAEPENEPGEKLPRYTSEQPMPECGKGWRQNFPPFGMMECQKPFVIEIAPSLKREAPTARGPAMY